MGKPLIPFGWLPGHWGLAGKTRQRAKAEYELSGVELEETLAKIDIEDESELNRKIAKIRYTHGLMSSMDYERCIVNNTEYDDPDERTIALMDIERRRALITNEEFDYKCAELKHKNDKDALELAIAKLDYEYGKISETEYDKLTATAKKEPYVAIINTEFDPNRPERGAFEFDWNDYFVEDLRKKGYGNNDSADDEIVEAWFKAVCYGVAMEDEIFEMVASTGMNVKQRPLGDGKTEYQ